MYRTMYVVRFGLNSDFSLNNKQRLEVLERDNCDTEKLLVDVATNTKITCKTVGSYTKSFTVE